MLSKKWLITLVIISALSVLTHQKTAINSCALNTLGPYVAPSVYTDCTDQDPKSGSCCMVTYQNSTQFCAYIPGSYVRNEAVNDFIAEFQNGDVTVQCSSNFLTFSFILAMLLVIIF